MVPTVVKMTQMKNKGQYYDVEQEEKKKDMWK